MITVIVLTVFVLVKAHCLSLPLSFVILHVIIFFHALLVPDKHLIALFAHLHEVIGLVLLLAHLELSQVPDLLNMLPYYLVSYLVAQQKVLAALALGLSRLNLKRVIIRRKNQVQCF